MRQSQLNYIVLQGEISQLQTEPTHVHYLRNIKQRQDVTSAVAMLQAAAGQAGAIISAQAATDEGDPVEGFTMQLAGKVVRGSFWKTTFKDGDTVQAVGYDWDGVFEAVAVTKPQERVIWMQPHCERGTKASSRSIIKKASIASFFLLASSPALSIFLNEPLWFSFLTTGSFSLMIWGVMVIWSWSDFMNFAQEMNAVGAALGLPEPENIDLLKSTKLARQNGKPTLPLGVYYY